jgi:hypothetical protein
MCRKQNSGKAVGIDELSCFMILGPVHLVYNPSYSACFLAETIFFSKKKSANSVFQPIYNSSRTTP